MSEHEGTDPGTDEADFRAPETGESAPDPSAPDHNDTDASTPAPEDYQPRNRQEQEVLLRNADLFLLEKQHEELKNERQSFPDKLLEKVGRRVDVRLSSQKVGWLKVPRLKVFETSRDQRAKDLTTAWARAKMGNWEKFVEEAAEKPENDQDVLATALFRTAYELRQNTLKLLAESERATPERQAEIEQEMNEAYQTLMTLTHTKSYELRREYDVKEKKGVDFLKLKKKRGETDGERYLRAKETVEQTKTLKDLRIETSLPPPDDPTRDPKQYGPDMRAWQQEWVGDRAQGETEFYKDDRDNLRRKYPTGFEQRLKHSGEFNAETLEQTEQIKTDIAESIDLILDTEPGKLADLEERFGFRATRTETEEKKRAKKKDDGTEPPSPRRDITVDLTQSLGPGSFSTLSLEPAGYYDPKASSYKLLDKPHGNAKKAYTKLALTNHLLRQDGQTKITTVLDGPNLEMLSQSREYTLVGERLTAILGELVGEATTEAQLSIANAETKLQSQLDNKRNERQAIVDRARNERRAFIADEGSRFETLDHDVKVLEEKIGKLPELTREALELTRQPATRESYKKALELRARVEFLG